MRKIKKITDILTIVQRKAEIRIYEIRFQENFNYS